jgi:hypothetical protein
MFLLLKYFELKEFNLNIPGIAAKILRKLDFFNHQGAKSQIVFVVALGKSYIQLKYLSLYKL